MVGGGRVTEVGGWPAGAVARGMGKLERVEGRVRLSGGREVTKRR